MHPVKLCHVGDSCGRRPFERDAVRIEGRPVHGLVACAAGACCVPAAVTEAVPAAALSARWRWRSARLPACSRQSGSDAAVEGHALKTSLVLRPATARCGSSRPTAPRYRHPDAEVITRSLQSGSRPNAGIHCTHRVQRLWDTDDWRSLWDYRLLYSTENNGLTIPFDAGA